MIDTSYATLSKEAEIAHEVFFAGKYNFCIIAEVDKDMSHKEFENQNSQRLISVIEENTKLNKKFIKRNKDLIVHMSTTYEDMQGLYVKEGLSFRFYQSKMTLLLYRNNFYIASEIHGSLFNDLSINDKENISIFWKNKINDYFESKNEIKPFCITKKDEMCNHSLPYRIFSKIRHKY